MKSLYQFWLRREKWTIQLYWKLFCNVFDLVILPYFIVLIGGMAVAYYWDYLIADRSWLTPVHGLLVFVLASIYIVAGRYLLPFTHADEGVLFTMPLKTGVMSRLSVGKQLFSTLMVPFLFLLFVYPVLSYLYRVGMIDIIRLTVVITLSKTIMMNVDWMIYLLKIWPRRFGLLTKWIISASIMIVGLSQLYQSTSEILITTLLNPWVYLLLMIIGTLTGILASKCRITDWNRVIDDAVHRRMVIYNLVYGYSEEKQKRSQRKALPLMRSRFRIPFTQKGALLELTMKGFIRKPEIWRGYLQLTIIFTLICWKIPYWFIQTVIIIFAIFILAELLQFMTNDKGNIWLRLYPFDYESKKGIHQGALLLLAVPILLMTTISFYHTIVWWVLPSTWVSGFIVGHIILSWKLSKPY